MFHQGKLHSCVDTHSNRCACKLSCRPDTQEYLSVTVLLVSGARVSPLTAAICRLVLATVTHERLAPDENLDLGIDVLALLASKFLQADGVELPFPPIAKLDKFDDAQLDKFDYCTLQKAPRGTGTVPTQGWMCWLGRPPMPKVSLLFDRLDTE